MSTRIERVASTRNPNPQPADPGRLAHGPRPCASLPSASSPSLTPTSWDAGAHTHGGSQPTANRPPTSPSAFIPAPIPILGKSQIEPPASPTPPVSIKTLAHTDLMGRGGAHPRRADGVHAHSPLDPHVAANRQPSPHLSALIPASVPILGKSEISSAPILESFSAFTG
ncbi:hypothetical protein T492DRAFT_973330, partial [Pavlovales sp. CCMP2436]